jgi:hypothetical protein
MEPLQVQPNKTIRNDKKHPRDRNRVGFYLILEPALYAAVKAEAKAKRCSMAQVMRECAADKLQVQLRMRTYEKGALPPIGSAT